MQHTTEIPRDGWDRFFARFSEEHETQFVAVEVMGPEIGAQVEGRSLLLGGISPADHNKDSLALTGGERFRVKQAERQGGRVKGGGVAAGIWNKGPIERGEKRGE